MTTIKKIKRGYWNVEPETGDIYASLHLRADYDNQAVWKRGWHLALRDKKTGAIIRRGQCHATRTAAITEALARLATVPAALKTKGTFYTV